MAKKKKPAGGNAIIYARYSSHNQRDVSIEQQIEACRKHAAELGLTITDTYEDRAISGRTDNRPAFQRMMRDAEDGKFQYVLAWKSNRMGRNMMQAMVNESRLMDCGVKVFYAEEDFDDSAAGRFALRSMMNVNQFYSDNLAEDVRRGLMDNASKCMANGRQPLGYKRGEGGKVVVDEPAAAIVREIYTRIASGEMFMDIARDLNRRGIKTQSGSEWNKSSFKVLCRNERYRGIYIYGDTRIEGGIPPIVDDVLWYKVQEVLKVKKSKNRHHCPSDEDYLLTGKLRCGKCGGYMIGMSGRSKTGDVHHYYACQNRRVGHTCDKKNIRRDVVEPAVAQAIKQYCLTDDAIEWITDQTIAYWEDEDRKLQIDSIENDLSAVQSSISNVMKAIEMGVITETTRDRLIELERQQTDLKSKLALAKEEIVHVDRKDLISSLLAFRHGNVHDRAYQEKLFNAFLIAVYVYDDDHLKLVFNSFGKDDTANIALDLGENDDNSGLSDVSKSSPILSNGQAKGASLRQQQRFFLERYAPLFQLYHREQQSFPPLIQVWCTLCRILGALEQLLRETLFLFCPGQKLLTARRHRQHPGGQPEVRPFTKERLTGGKLPPQAAGIQKQILTQAVAGPLRQMLLRRKEGLLQRFSGPGTKLHGSSRIRGISRSLRELIEQCHIPLLRCLFQQQRPDNAFFGVFTPQENAAPAEQQPQQQKPQCGPAAHGLTSQTLRPRNFSQSSRRM